MSALRFGKVRMTQAFLVLLSLLLAACVVAPTADVDATVRAALAATQTAQPTATSTSTPLPTHTQTSTPVPTATLTPEPTATLTPTAPPTATSTASPIPIDTPVPGTAESEPYAVVGVASDDLLNVRSGPGVDRPVVGTIPFYGMDVRVAGKGQQAGDALWVPVRYQDVAGWVNNNYLARQVGRVEGDVAARAAEIIWAIQDKDLDGLSGFVHPEKGVRFSPYTYVRTEQEPVGDRDLVFSAAQVVELFGDQTVYHWGWFDGSGEPIELTLEAYWERFVYDVDFFRPHVIGYDQIIGQGNTINNIAQAYPGATTVEYHFEGFENKYAGMDWRSLRLVLAKYEGDWYLVGVVHDEWTI